MKPRSRAVQLAGLWVLLTSLVVPQQSAFADDTLWQEFGSMAVDHYVGTCPAMGWDMDWQPFRNGLRYKLSAAGWTESAPFPLDDADCYSRHINKAPGDNLGDEVDLFLWSGHSFLGQAGPKDPKKGTPGYGAELHMVTEHLDPCQCDCIRTCGNIVHTEVALGMDDNEVAMFVTCQWLANYNQLWIYNEIKKMHQGNHLILGFATSSWDWGKKSPWQGGTYLGGKLLGVPPTNPRPILYAWGDTVRYWQPSGTIGRVHYWHGDCYNDYLQGNWRGWGFGGQPPAANDSNLDQFDSWDAVSP